MNIKSILAVAAALICTSSLAQDLTGRETILFAAEPFPFSDVTLEGDSPFLHAQDLDAQWLLSLQPDRFLARFRINSGLEPRAEGYYGWEGGGAAGHCFGHYLSACSRFYANTGDKRFKEIVDYCIDELEECQNARGTGYLGAMPEEDRIWSEVSSGDIRYIGGSLNGGWVPMYTLHKVHAGLVDAYRYGGSEKARELFSRLVDWEVKEFAHLTQEQFADLLCSEFGGMNDVLAESYAITGDTSALDLARQFYHAAILDPLAISQDNLEGKHSNTQIPKVIGEARIYELTGDNRERGIAEFFWDTMVHNHSYVNGGNSNHEHLGKPGQLNDQLSASTTETCNTYNMLKLTRHLFLWDGDAARMDYFERALYNHILASQNPETGLVSYFLPLMSGTYKTFCQSDSDFFCCTGTGLENHSKYAESIFFRSTEDDGLFVTLFIGSQLDWKEKGIKVRMKTAFPYDNKVDISFEGKARRFPLHIRFPEWIHSDMTVNVNGKERAYSRDDDSFITINGRWSRKSKVTITLPMDIHTVSMPDNPSRLGVFYGPVLLCADLGREYPEEMMIPRFIGTIGDVPSKITSTDLSTLRFQAETSLGEPVTFMPFFEIHDRYHAVYHDVVTEEQWKEEYAEYIARLEYEKALEKRTLDYVYCGEQQSERDHGLVQSNSGTGFALGKHFRHGVDASFSYVLASSPSKPVELHVNVWGSDNGNRVFDVLVEGQLVKTISLDNNRPGVFYDEVLPVGQDITKGKDHVTVTFSSHPDNYAGGVFGLRLAVAE